MTVAIFALILVGIAVMVATHVAVVKRMEAAHVSVVERLEARDEGRANALYQQHKQAMRDVARVNNSAQVAVENAHRVFEDARLMHARVDGFFAHPAAKRMLDEGAPGREPEKGTT